MYTSESYAHPYVFNYVYVCVCLEYI
jgi:hypothetical protein